MKAQPVLVKPAEWHEARRTGIGGSDAAVVLGLSDYKTPLQLWKEKRGEIEPEDLDKKEWVVWGKLLEDCIAGEYARRSGNKVRRCNTTCRSKARPWQLCNIDRDVVVDGKFAKGLEVKTMGAFAYDAREWGTDGSSDVRADYYAQVQHEMSVTEYDVFDLALLIGGQQMRVFEVKRDEVFIERMNAAEDAFMQSVANGNPPPPVNLDDLKLLYPAATRPSIEATDEVASAWGVAMKLRKAVAAAEVEIDKRKLLIQSHMGDAERLEFNGEKLCTWNNTAKGGRRFCFNDNTPIKAPEPFDVSIPMRALLLTLAYERNCGKLRVDTLAALASVEAVFPAGPK